MTPEILSFVLRNSPLRVVKVSSIIGISTEIPRPKLRKDFSQSPHLITLDTVLSECPQLTEARLKDTPDNLFIFFRSETATFSISGPVTETSSSSGSKYHYFEIRSSANEVIGQTDACVPDDPDDPVYAGEFEFVLLATSVAPDMPPRKITLQIERREGVAYRISVAYILEDAWNKADRRSELVVLG